MINRNSTWFKWTQEESEKLAENWNKLDIDQIASKLGRTESAVRNQASKLGLRKQTRRNATPESIVKYVTQNAGKIPVSEMAKETGYSEAGVYGIGFRFGVSFKVRDGFRRANSC